MKKKTNDRSDPVLRTENRCDKDLPGHIGSGAVNNIDLFFSNFVGEGDIPPTQTSNEPRKPILRRDDPVQAPPVYADVRPAADPNRLRPDAPADFPAPPSAGEDVPPRAGKRNRRIIPAVVLALLLAVIGTALYFCISKRPDVLFHGDARPAEPPVSEEAGATQPPADADRPTETAAVSPETTAAASPETTAPPDRQYGQGTYYVDAYSGTPLFSEPYYYSGIYRLIPDGEKVVVTDVQSGHGFDGQELYFGKVTYQSQSGWIKMDRTSAEPPADGSRRIDYDAVLHCNAAYWKSYADRSVLSAYAAVAERLTAEYGTGRTGDTKEAADELCGLFIVRLIDLDRDGLPELYCAYAKEGESEQAKRQAVYRYIGDGKTERLYEGEYTAKGSDYSPFVWFRENNGVLYFVAGSGPERYYYRLEDGAFTGISFAGWAGYFIDDKKVTADEYEKTIAQYERGAADYTIAIYGKSEGDSKHSAYVDWFLAETERVVALLAQDEKAAGGAADQPNAEAAPWEERYPALEDGSSRETVAYDMDW